MGPRNNVLGGGGAIPRDNGQFWEHTLLHTKLYTSKYTGDTVDKVKDIGCTIRRDSQQFVVFNTQFAQKGVLHPLK